MILILSDEIYVPEIADNKDLEQIGDPRDVQHTDEEIDAIEDSYGKMIHYYRHIGAGLFEYVDTVMPSPHEKK